MSAFIGEIEFWALVVLVFVGGAFVFLAAAHWTGKRMAGLSDRALQDKHKDEQKRKRSSRTDAL